MSTPEAAAAPAAPPKRKRPIALIIGGVLLLVGMFAGGLFAARAGLVPGIAAAPVEPDRPKLVYEDSPGPDGPKLKTSYFRIAGSFTTNMRASERLVQLELGVSTNYDERVIQAVERHDLPIRSAVLGVLSLQEEAALSTPEGRAALQRQLKDAVNRVLNEKEGFGGIADVYFASLIIQ